MGRSGATAAAARWRQAQEGAWGQDSNDCLAPGVRTPPPGAPENLLGRFLKVQTQDLPKRISVARPQGGPRAWPDKQVHPVPGEENAQEGSQVLGGCLQAARTPGPPRISLQLWQPGLPSPGTRRTRDSCRLRKRF